MSGTTRARRFGCLANGDNAPPRDEHDSAIGVSGALGTSGTSGVSRNGKFDCPDSNRNNPIERHGLCDGSHWFNWLDRNGDGWLSRGEIVGARPATLLLERHSHLGVRLRPPPGVSHYKVVIGS